MVATETLMLVEHPQEDIKDRVASIVGAGFAVDVKQDDIGTVGNGLVDVGTDGGITQFARIKEGNSLAGVALVVARFDVGQKV
ncbi:hypothetical protein D3C76_846630 [compost metagenome]